MKIYEDSRYENNNCTCFMARNEGEKFLIVTGGTKSGDFEGEPLIIEGKTVKKCPLNVFNSRLIREVFPFSAPVTAQSRRFSIGLGDRLGIASPGHIKAIRGTGAFPILAQQSIRELSLTGRTYDDVLSDATWAVLQEGYEGGYGADGDHLKTRNEVKIALDAGLSMITLDCSEYIGKSEKVSIPAEYMAKYRGRNFKLKNGVEMKINEVIFDETMEVYGSALKFTEEIFNDLLKDRLDIDFELSIDETMTPTKPEAHFLIAAWLKDNNVRVLNIAPRFCGEFQKGIDYKGNLGMFEREFVVHQAIAEHFGHRLSIHSGSDKFSVFPIIGRITGLNCHVKTAGTNWLEALRCIACSQPELFRKMYIYAMEILDKAKVYYHIYTEKYMAPEIEAFDDENLSALLDINESRQILHVTYGFLLNDNSSFREQFFTAMHHNESLYYKYLTEHIRRHLFALNFPIT